MSSLSLNLIHYQLVYHVSRLLMIHLLVCLPTQLSNSLTTFND